jgi:hypothetical protein
MGEPAVDNQRFVLRLPLTGTLVDFLRAELLTYRAVMRRKDFGTWTDSTLTDAILGCPAVPDDWQFGDETLRRFLKNSAQPPGEQMLRAVAIFLLEKKWITRGDIGAHDKDPVLRAGIALQSFFTSDRKPKTLDFHKELGGTYIRYGVLPGRFVRTVLRISAHADPPVLRVSQRENVFRTSAAERILQETLGLRPQLFRKIENLLRSHAQEVGTTRYAFGFAVAGPTIVSAFLKNELGGEAVAYLVDAIGFGESDGLAGEFNAVRYAGWSSDGKTSEPTFRMQRVPEDVAELAGQVSAAPAEEEGS